MLDFAVLEGSLAYQKVLEETGFRQRLVFFRSGVVTLAVKGEEVRVEGPAVINHSPLVAARVTSANLGPSYLLAFDGPDLDRLVAEAFLLLCPMTGVCRMTLTEGQFAILETVLGLMAGPPLPPDLRAVQALLVVKYLARFQNDANSRRFSENALVKRYVARVDRDHGTTHEVAAYADSLGVSTRTLNRVFKEATGITPKASLSYRLNLAAKSQLLEPDRSVKQISYDLGFRSPEYFHSFFRKANGQTPGTYRLSSAFRIA